MYRAIIILLIGLRTNQSLSAQDSLSKAEILDKMKIFRQGKYNSHRILTEDSVFFYKTHLKSPEYNYVEFLKLGKKKNRVVYQFYFLDDQLIFINQRSNRKHYSVYFFNNGRIFDKELDATLTELSQQEIDQLKSTLLSKNSFSVEF